MKAFDLFNIFVIWLVAVVCVGGGFMLLGMPWRRVAGFALILTVPYLFGLLLLDALGVVQVHWQWGFPSNCPTGYCPRSTNG